MSETQVKAVERLYAAWNDGGLSSFGELLSADVEWHEPSEVPGSAVHAGKPAVLDYVTSLIETIGQFTCDVIDTAASGDAVLARLRMYRSQSRSGVPVDVEVFHLHFLRDEEISRVDAFMSREDAYAALAAA